MKLSIIIINYNVKFFLEQALLAVRKATTRIETEIFVVDNHSVDGSIELVKEKFPEVILIANKDNAGFSKANNQAIKIAKGEYILLLNPDTVVEEDTFEKCIAFMDAHPQAGGLGVKMIDGTGKFLPESKRSFPSPSVAFYKAFGFSKLFPKSAVFAKYHLGHLSENETHEVEVLAGAFMWIRKKVLDEIGLLDEDFFMYGEDIDLSYRIVKAGYKNYYFADTRIIHYKGESTKKTSVNYVKVFYNAMIIFAEKHFAGSRAKSFIGLLRLAIYFRAMASLLGRLLKNLTWPLLDGIVIYGGMFFLKTFWQNNIKVSEGLTYPSLFMYMLVPAYILIWLSSVYFSGGYDRSSKISKIVRGIFAGTLIIAALYGFLDESFRFSRALIILGAAWAVFSMVTIRLAYNLFKKGKAVWGEEGIKRIIIVGNEAEALRVEQMLNSAKVPSELIGFVFPNGQSNARNLGAADQLVDIASIYKCDEIIFCSQDISSQKIIEWMTRIGNKVDFKIVPEESLSIIGSNSKDAAGDLYTIDIVLNIATQVSKRNKRIFDLGLSCFLLITLPLNFWFVKQKPGYVANIFRVLFGKLSWVGYSENEEQKLPAIRKGVLSPKDELIDKKLDQQTRSRLDLLYAKNYFTSQDILIVRKGFRNLGNND